MTRRGTSALVVAVVGAVVVATVACTAGSEGDDDGPLDPVGERVELSEPGFHELPPPPIADRGGFGGGGSVSVWTGRELIVWGGASGDDPSSPGRSLGDGASFDLDEGRWRPLPRSPFPDGLYHPMGAWDGTELIVIGTWCEAEIPPVTDGSPPPCPEGPAAAAYDPVDGTWRQLDPPPIPPDSFYGEPVLPTSRRAVAVGGSGTARFAFDWPGRAITWDRAEGWGSVDDAGGDQTNTDLCVDTASESVAVLTVPQPGSGTTAARVLAPGADQWTDPVDLGVAVREPASCGSGLLVGVQTDDPTEHASGYDLETGASVPLAEPPSEVTYANPFAIDAWIVLDQTVLDDEGARLRTFRVRGVEDPPDRWVEVEAPLSFSLEPGGALPLGGIGIVSGGFGVSDGQPLVLWRLPEELTS